MMLSALVYSLLATYLATVQAVSERNCTDVSQCDPGECCQILRRYMVVSRRVAPIDEYEKTGTCQLYKGQGQACGGFAEMNGYCGCAPGLTCRAKSTTPTTSLSKAKRIMAPGYYTCEP